MSARNGDKRRPPAKRIGFVVVDSAGCICGPLIKSRDEANSKVDQLDHNYRYAAPHIVGSVFARRTP